MCAELDSFIHLLKMIFLRRIMIYQYIFFDVFCFFYNLMSTHFAELHRVFDLLHFLPSVPDHHLNITLHHFHLSLNIRTGNKTKTGIKVQRLALYVIG